MSIFIGELDKIVQEYRENGCSDNGVIIDYHNVEDLESMMEDDVAAILKGYAREGKTSGMITFTHIDNDVFLGIQHHANKEWEIYTKLIGDELRDFIDRRSEKTAKIKFHWSTKE